MSTTVQLPPTLRQRLAALAARIRFLRGLRGVSVLVTVLALTAAVAVGIDWLLDGRLPLFVRGINLAVWSCLGVLLAWAGYRSLTRPLDPADLAAAVEQLYPELGERLTSSVELCESAGDGNGSPALIELLVRETEARTHPLDFRSVISGRSTLMLTSAAAFLLVAAVAPGVVAPQQYSPFVKRFLAPWLTPGALPEFTITVPTGDAVAARGRTVEILADLTPRHSRIALPGSATLVVIDDGKSVRHDMRPDEKTSGRYGATVKAAGDFSYRVESGNARSDTHTVTAVTPVELTGDSPQITITPPAYARATVETQTRTGMVDLSALKHSDVSFAFAFTRPAVKAWVEWKTLGEKETKPIAEKADLPLVLAPDRQSGTLALPAFANAEFKLILVAEHDIRTEYTAALVVRPDLPPSLIKYTGKETTLNARAFDRIPIEARLADDIAVAGAELVYTVNDDKKEIVERLTLQNGGTREATARLAWMLAGKVKAGDKVRFRLRYRDNLPKQLGGPNVRYYPEDRWLEVAVIKDGKSFREEDIASKRDTINKLLDEIKAELKHEKRVADRVRAESRNHEQLGADHLETLRELRKQNQFIQKQLEEVAREADATPELQSLAKKARDIAKQEMAEADRALEDTTKRDMTPNRREGRFRDADTQLDAALKKLDDVKQLNDKLAKEQLDQARVEALADRQEQLAQKAEELTGKHPTQDPQAKQLTDDLKKEQADVEQELKKLTDNSDALKKALEEARAEQARQAAQKAEELAQAQRDLAKASDQTERKLGTERLADLARKQKELADRAEKFARESTAPLKATRAKAPNLAPAAKAADELAKGDADKALQEQDRAAGELDRLANELDKSAKLGSDPREAAKQLAAQQKDLVDRTAKEEARKDADRPLAERLKDLKAEQQALQKAAEKLSLPPKNQAAQQEKARAQQELAKATEALEKGNAPQARKSMDDARQALERLRQKVPSLADRQMLARQEVERLRQEQGDIARQADQAAKQKDGEKKLSELAKRQAALADRLANLDAPNQDARRDRAAEAAAKALEDLRAASKEDQAASQAQAKRDLDRLAQALQGQKPADEKAADLAQKQRELLAKAEKASTDPKTPESKRDELKNDQHRLADEARALDTKEAPATKRGAEEAVARASEKAKDDPTAKKAREAMAEAAKKLDELAKAAAGQESESEKAERVARRQDEEAARSKKGQPEGAAKQRQKEIGEEAKTVRAGEEARAEKQKAAEALQRAESTKGEQQAKAQDESARALKELADKLAGKKDDATKPANPQQQVRELARQQAEMAKQTQQAKAKQPDDAGKKAQQEALEKLAQQQKKLTDESAKLPAKGQQQQLEQARHAMDQARQSMEKNDVDRAARKQQEAARVLDKLAEQLPQKAPPTAKKDDKDDKAQPLPSKQTEQARQLAREQRNLRQQVQQEAEKARAERRADNAGQDNPAGKLAKEQTEIAREAQKLAQEVGKEQGEKAGATKQAKQADEAAKQAARDLQSGALPQAEKAARQTGDQLRDLARQLSQTPRGKGEKDTLQQARELARRQDEVNQQLGKMAQDPKAQRTQQQARQQDLQQQTGELAKQLDRMGQTPGKSPPAQSQSQQAAAAAKQAQQQMQQAQGQTKQGDQGATQQSRDQAARMLDQAARAAKQAEQLAKQAGQQSGQPSQKQTGQAVQQAREQMGQAQGELTRSQPSAAQRSMQQAAEAMKQAAQQMPQPGQPKENSQPTAQGAAPGGDPDAKRFGKPKLDFDGKNWGELPGEVRSKMVQEMKAKYGEDYARMIKLYFEQLADTRKK